MLYNWPAAMTACPSGWHLPHDAEWKQLEVYLGMTQKEAGYTGYRGTSEGGKLKETGTKHWSGSNTGATNSSGFTALPGGIRSYGYFQYIGDGGCWWSASINTEYYAWFRGLSYQSGKINRAFTSKEEGFSIRCVKDY